MKHPIFKTTGVVLLATTVMSFSTVQTAEAKQWDMCSWDEIPRNVLNRIIRRPDYEDILRRMFIHCPEAANALANPLVMSASDRTLKHQNKQNAVERVSFDSTSSAEVSASDASGRGDSIGRGDGADAGSSSGDSNGSGDTNGSDGGGSSSGDSNTSGDSSSSTGSDGGRGSNANNGGGNGSEGDSPGKGKGANNDE